MNKVMLFVLITIFTISCEDAPIPKPLGYYRIDFPEKQYINYDGNCPYTFEYPKRSLLRDKIPGKPDCWMNLHYPQYGATIHFTYNELEAGSLGNYIEDSRKLVMKHIVKADDIVENLVNNESEKVYGLTYDFSGNTATIYQFSSQIVLIIFYEGLCILISLLTPIHCNRLARISKRILHILLIHLSGRRSKPIKRIYH